MKKLGVRSLPLALITMLALNVNGISAQDESNNEAPVCIVQNENPVNPQTLPDNMRLIIQRSTEEDVLYLVDPKNNTQRLIPNSNGLPLLFGNATKLLLFTTFDNSRGTRIVAMNIDGTNHTMVFEAQEQHNVIARLLDDHLLITGQEQYRIVGWVSPNYPIYQLNMTSLVLNLLSGEIETFEEPELHDPEQIYSAWPEGEYDIIYYHYHYDPMMSRVAYWANPIDESGEVLLDQPLILRMQELATGESIDIVPDIAPDESEDFGWYGSTEHIYVRRGWTPAFMIFDASNGRLIEEVTPPGTFDVAARSFAYMEEYPEKHLLAVLYIPNSTSPTIPATPTGELVLAIYDEAQLTWARCFWLEHARYDPWGVSLNWLPGGRYIWWVEAFGWDPEQFNLILADIETGAYGVIAENVGPHSCIGFLDE